MTSDSTQGVTSQRGVLSPKSSRTGQQSLFTRFQALLPTSPNTTTLPPAQKEVRTTSSHSPSVQPSPRFLKIRVLTWNMHDSVPKGDLEELLGSIPQHPASADSLSSDPELPILPNDTHHPYHLILIAGQECPTTLGIPMGLGAGFKFVDKDKDKDWDKDKEKAREKHKDQKDKDDPSGRRKIPEDEVAGHSHTAHSHAGWTSMVEESLCYIDIPATGASSSFVSNFGMGHPPDSADPHRNPNVEQRKGPYQLLVKERMMGIYLAAYINRDIRHLVKGTSKSAVTAGLIGGRVGNKGGVGISLNIGGITFLFINAHLAAHGGKQHHRLANLSKIKAELVVDDFLRADDPRLVAEDLTDRFDYTFICGDLNFRLDISRLHADWLISRHEYSQALAFDQLQILMKKGEAFVGFKEAPINFPPTFKYDVLPLRKKRGPRRQPWKRFPDRANHSAEVEERELERLDNDDNEEECDGEAVSVSSSVVTSPSKPGTDPEDEDYFHATPLSGSSTPGSRVSLTMAAQKAKSMWLELVSPSFVPVTNSPRRPKFKHGLGPPLTPKNKTSDTFLDVPTSTPPSEPHSDTELYPSRIALMRANSATSIPDSPDEEENKCVYDSSHKKRVPSWCDRILWKSTVQPDSKPEDAARPRTRMGTFFSNALSLSGRSFSSMTSPTPSARPSMTLMRSSSPVSEIEEDAPDTATPCTRFTPPKRPGKIHHSKSNESMRVTEKPRLLRNLSHGVDPRARCATIGVYSPSSTTREPPDIPHKSPTLPTPSRWRFLSFLSRDSGTAGQEEHLGMPPPRKGDVVCLSYNTLDDRAMRRLDGRSDHRPVIGSYAVYI